MATVLVVDDEFGIGELFEAVLEEEGYRVLTAVNGQHGPEVLAQDRADLVFLDYMMPVMNGAAMLEAMMADPALRSIPVVLMSSLPEAIVASRSQRYAAFLRKPFTLRKLVELTAQLLARGGSPVS